METAVIYLRQSKARDDSISLEIQEAACRSHCEQLGYAVGAVVADEGVSGYRDWTKRPEFHQVLDADAQVVVVYRWSRLSRRRLDQVSLIQMLDEAGRRVEAAAEPIDPSTAGGRFSRDMMLSIAAFESDVKSEQWKEALARRVAHGLPKNGLPRFGYVRDGDGYAPDPVTGPVLREMYQRYSCGAGFQALVKDLNRRGITTTRGRTWGVQSLIRALDSGFGAGLLIERQTNTFAVGAHEAVITEEQWQRYRRVRESRRMLPSKRKNPRWYLAGLACCGICGAPLIVNSYDVKHSQAMCSRYKNQRTCTGVWVNRHALEAQVGIWLGAHLEELARGVDSRAASRAEAQTHVEELRDALTANQAALGRLASGWAQGLLDETGYRGAQAELMARRDHLEKELRAAAEEADRLGPVELDAFDTLAAAPSMSPGEWGHEIGKVLRRVSVHKGQRFQFEPVSRAPSLTATTSALGR